MVKATIFLANSGVYLLLSLASLSTVHSQPVYKIKWYLMIKKSIKSQDPDQIHVLGYSRYMAPQYSFYYYHHLLIKTRQFFTFNGLIKLKTNNGSPKMSRFGPLIRDEAGEIMRKGRHGS